MVAPRPDLSPGPGRVSSSPMVRFCLFRPDRAPKSQFKPRAGPADVNPMSAHPENLTWTQSDTPIRVVLDAQTDYTMFGDEQLLTERDRQRKQLEELTMHPGCSPTVSKLRASIDHEVERMTDEIRRRERLRHPSSQSLSGRLRSLRSLSWPPSS